MDSDSGSGFVNRNFLQLMLGGSAGVVLGRVGDAEDNPGTPSQLGRATCRASFCEPPAP